ncbi:MAG: FKBP-type peptidyl-prolyl cis-trans isomerase [Chitinophagaceae bacterium]
MNKSTILLATAILGTQIVPHAQTTKKRSATTHSAKPAASTTAVTLKSETDSLSYAIGLEMATFYKAQGIDNINIAVLDKALRDGMSESGTPLLSHDAAQNIMMTTAQKMMAKKAEATKKEGTDFLAKNKLKDSVVTLPDGLEYKILKAGTGPKPTASDKVKVHYVGTLLDGTEFDNSIKRGEPLDIEVGGVIKGWTEALQLMPVGSKWRLFIPSDLAYGDRAAGPIKAGSTLIFDVELLDILKEETAPADSTSK